MERKNRILIEYKIKYIILKKRILSIFIDYSNLI